MSALWFLVSALHEPYVLAFEPSFVEIRHIETGLLSQVIQGSNLRLLFADTPPSVTNASSANQYNPYQQHGSVFHFRVDESTNLFLSAVLLGITPMVLIPDNHLLTIHITHTLTSTRVIHRVWDEKKS